MATQEVLTPAKGVQVVRQREVSVPAKDLVSTAARREKARVTYQIYPISFFDSNGDGKGDIPGITAQIDYLSGTLGVNSLWLTPPYVSPWVDGGYDVEDYMRIDPQFGTTEHMKELIDAAHTRDMKVYLDLPLNHTSNKHQWFERSRRATDDHDPLRDFYIWADPKPDGSPPNNWQSFFGGSAWTYDEERRQYYFHKFTPEQPDLNLRNPLVKKSLKNMMRRWLDVGVDGFRLDVISHTFEDPDFADMIPLNGAAQTVFDYHWQPAYLRPESYDFAEELAKEMPTGTVLIGEIYSEIEDSFDRLAEFSRRGIEPFYFGLLDVTNQYGANASEYKRNVERYLAVLPEGTRPTFVLGNHDQERLRNKLGPNFAAVTAMMLALGTEAGSHVFIYQGDEYGAENVVTPVEEITDPQARNGVAYDRGVGRAPLQWDDSPHGGFSPQLNGGKTWMRVGETSGGRNIKDQLAHEGSQLNLTREMMRFRSESPALWDGTYVSYPQVDRDVFHFGRVTEEQKVLVSANLSANTRRIPLPDGATTRLLFTTNGHALADMIEGSDIVLPPHTTCYFELN